MRNKADSPHSRSNKKSRKWFPSDSPRQRRAPGVFSFVRDWGLWLMLALTIAVLGCYMYLQTKMALQDEPHTLLLQQKGMAVRRARNRTHVDGVGFVFLGLGPYARQLKCEAAIESLRRHGGWDGPVFLLTDAPRCYRRNRVWTECSIEATVVDVHDDLSSGFTMPSLYKTRGNRLKSKKYKTRIFELVADAAAEVLIYVDCDMLVAGAANGLDAFVHEYKDAFDEKTRIFVFPENNPTAINGVVHTGIFVAHRRWSAPILKRWAEQLDTERDASDQAAFVRAGITEYRFVDEGKYLYRPRCDRDNCLTLEPLLFNHINGARCWNQGKEEIQTFVNRWELCTYKRYNYCFPWYMTHFAMSWLPYSSCTKMEEGRTVL